MGAETNWMLYKQKNKSLEQPDGLHPKQNTDTLEASWEAWASSQLLNPPRPRECRITTPAPKPTHICMLLLLLLLLCAGYFLRSLFHLNTAWLLPSSATAVILRFLPLPISCFSISSLLARLLSFCWRSSR